jgi:hypothetical protein
MAFMEELKNILTQVAVNPEKPTNVCKWAMAVRLQVNLVYIKWM